MNKIIAITALVLASVSTFGQFVLSSPTKGQVYYSDEPVTVTWSGADPGFSNGQVKFWASDKNGEKYLTARPQFLTTFDLTPTMLQNAGLNGTNITIRVESSTSVSVPIVILGGSRPVVTPPPIDPPSTNTTWKAIDVSIRRQVSVEWPVVSGRTYRLEKSTDLVTWVSVVEGMADFTDIAGLSEYAEATTMFYRCFVKE